MLRFKHMTTPRTSHRNLRSALCKRSGRTNTNREEMLQLHGSFPSVPSTTTTATTATTNQDLSRFSPFVSIARKRDIQLTNATRKSIWTVNATTAINTTVTTMGTMAMDMLAVNSTTTTGIRLVSQIPTP